MINKKSLLENRIHDDEISEVNRVFFSQVFYNLQEKRKYHRRKKIVNVVAGNVCASVYDILLSQNKDY